MRPLLPTRRLALLALSACALAHTPLHAQSTDYPNKPVRFINAWAPGGPADVLARSLGDALQTQLKQPFITENKPGAAGNIGADMVAKSPADGYTVMFGIDTTFTINPHIYPTMPFKPGDLKPLMVLASSGMMVVATPLPDSKACRTWWLRAKRRASISARQAAAAPATWPPRYWVTPRA